MDAPTERLLLAPAGEEKEDLALGYAGASWAIRPAPQCSRRMQSHMRAPSETPRLDGRRSARSVLRTTTKTLIVLAAAVVLLNLVFFGYLFLDGAKPF